MHYTYISLYLTTSHPLRFTLAANENHAQQEACASEDISLEGILLDFERKELKKRLVSRPHGILVGNLQAELRTTKDNLQQEKESNTRVAQRCTTLKDSVNDLNAQKLDLQQRLDYIKRLLREAKQELGDLQPIGDVSDLPVEDSIFNYNTLKRVGRACLGCESKGVP